MLPNPLHPAVVHFPIVLMFLLPISALIAAWAIRRGSSARNTWAVPVGIAAALTLSAWASLQTGQEAGEAVETRVPEQIVEGHEEGAELFLALSGVVFVVTAAGLAGGAAAKVMRPAAVVASAALVFAGYRVGHSGGELVYKHGAASAIAQGGSSGADRPSATSAAPSAAGPRGERESSEREAAESRRER